MKQLLELFSKYKKFFLFSLVFYLFFAFLGFLFANQNSVWATAQIEKISLALESLVRQNIFEQAAVIFFHNLFVQLILLFSFFLLGAAPAISLATNGLAIGVIFAIFPAKIGTTQTLFSLLPHGIIELPTFFLTAAISFQLSVQFVRSVSKKRPFGLHFAKAIKLFYLVVIPLTALAAIVEIFLTPQIVSLFE